MSGKWTKGPWVIGDGGPILYEGMLRPVWNIYGSRGLRDGPLVASVEHFQEDEFPNASARLIAAAPSLYAALETFVAEYVELVNSCDAGFWNPEAEDKVIAARAALSLARGEQ